MHISAVASTLALLGLAACSAGPESYASMTTGVGFGDYQRYLHERDAARSASTTPYSVPPEVHSAEAIVPPTSMPPAPTSLAAVPPRYVPAPAPPVVASRPLAAAPIAQAQITARPLAPLSQSTVQPPVQIAAAPVQPHPVAPANSAPDTSVRTVQASATFGTTPSFDPGPSVRPGISDEQDFQAVSARESIASDRDRLARQRAQYQVIEVATVPDSSVSGGPNIVAFALSTSHAPGTEVYRRINPLRWSRWESACLQYRNQDAAQEAFLADGGPERDSGNLDPDGDGYACWWDPTPLRHAMASN